LTKGSVRPDPLARPPCVCSFHSKCQTAARVRSFSRRGCVRGFLLSQKTKAASARPLTEAHLKGGLPAIKGGEAPKSACHPVSAPFLPEGRGCGSDPSQTSLRSLRNLSACGTARLPALRCGACPASERQDSAQAALHAKHDAKALPPLRIALKRGTLRPGRCAGGDDARTARERGYKPRPQEPHSLHQLAVTGRRP
jgi:hypothetical protein